ncbi:ORF59 [macacine gammaherpesvirus 12]|uniref:ORF59 n=1 Tax=macacine gammaherpesvirus 12 TaxID=2560571 RepID=A0A0B5CYW9_9GAMA|nr:ORF59 [Macaca nemestrina rhadinovirus 2]AJE29715.1 ORF59 [Macaca nemestrina rhadinovirus 2]
MPVSFHYGARVDVEALGNIRRVYEHIKGSVKKGVIQISGQGRAPVLSVLSSVGDAGVLGLRLKNALAPLMVYSDMTDEVSFSFRNTSLGNTFTHTREMFGVNITEMNVAFYHHGDEADPNGKPQFVRTTIAYGDNHTSTVHKSVVDETNLPSFHDRLEQAGTGNRLFLTGKTLTLLSKWLRQQKTRARQVVTVSLSETLAVATFTVDGVSKIIDFKPDAPDAKWTCAKGKKLDVGVVSSDLTTHVSLESLVAALSACKIPGYFLPGFRWHANEILEVEGLPLTDTLADVKLGVMLLKVDPTGQENAVPGNLAKGAEEGIAECPSPPKTPDLDLREERCVPDAADCAESSDGGAKSPRTNGPRPDKRHAKRKHSSSPSRGKSKGKTPRATFNPLF